MKLTFKHRMAMGFTRIKHYSKGSIIKNKWVWIPALTSGSNERDSLMNEAEKMKKIHLPLRLKSHGRHFYTSRRKKSKWRERDRKEEREVLPFSHRVCVNLGNCDRTVWGEKLTLSLSLYNEGLKSDEGLSPWWLE